MTDGIYLDHHATTPLDPRVRGVMEPWLGERFGNAASMTHAYGHRAAEAVAAARDQIALALGCSAEEIIFTSGATEGNNLALKGVMQAAGRGKRLIVNAAEHPSVLDPARRLRRQGFDVTTLSVDGVARVDPAAVDSALGPDTALVSVMLANNEVGTINPLSDIATLCRDRDVPVHCDAAQAIGKVPVDLARLPVHLLSFTAHKMYGPQGVGALFIRKTDPPLPIVAQIDGGGHERRLRSGTLPVALIVGFGEACRIAAAEGLDESARLTRLRDRLWQRFRDELSGLTLNGPVDERLAGNLNVSFDGVDGDALVAGLDGLAVSSGSACTSADPQPSHVLRAMGVDERRSLASLRFGLGRFTTEEEIEQAAEIVLRTVRRLRET